MSAQACVSVCERVSVCACVGPKRFAHLFMGLAQREGSKRRRAEAANEADEPQNAPTGGKNRTWCTSWFGHPPPRGQRLLPKLHNSNAHSLMQIALGACPLHREREREYLNIFYDLIKHFY